MLPQENFCLNKASAAGNTSRIVKAVNTVQAEIIRGSAYSLRTRPHKKKASRVSACFSKFIPNKKGEALFPKAGFHLYSWADALE